MFVLDSFELFLVVLLSASPVVQCKLAIPVVNTETLVRSHGYPSEWHDVQTSDGYILRMFRIPSNDINSASSTGRPVVFVMHGLLSSSDSWVLSKTGQSMAFDLANAGFDVWLGNARGNTYGRHHKNCSPHEEKFWQYEWHQIGIYDLPAMIDYVLKETQKEKLHYIGHSQGTTSLLVMLSTKPEYNAKIMSAHLLAPVAYMKNMASPLAKVIGPFLGMPTKIIEILGPGEFMSSSILNSMLGAEACKLYSPLQDACANSLFLMAGFNSARLNKTLLPEILKTHPAGASVNQVVHYMQEHMSGRFCQFDYGILSNQLKYGSIKPPEYDLKAITAPIYAYYSDNDWMAAVKDVEKLLKQLPNVKLAYRMPDKKWNHLDYLWAKDVTEMLYNVIIEKINSYLN